MFFVSIKKRLRWRSAACTRLTITARLAIVLVGILAALPTVMRPAAAPHLAFQPFDDESGLFHEGGGSLAQDKAGFLYFGTENGLYRYDGYRFSRLGAENGLPALDSVETVQPHPD